MQINRCFLFIFLFGASFIAKAEFCIKVKNLTTDTDLEYSSDNISFNVCPGENIEMSAINCDNGNPVSVTWTNTSTASSTTGFSRNTIDAGNFSATKDGQSFSINISRYPNESFSIEGSENKPLCSGDAITLKATPGKTDYNWTKFGTTTSLGTSNILELENATGGDYVVTAIGDYSCKLSASTYIFEIAKPVVNLGTDTMSVCVSRNFILKDPNLAGTHYKFLWTVPFGASAITPTTTTTDSIIARFSVIPSNTAFRLTVIDPIFSSCSTTVIKHIQVDGTLTVSAGNSTNGTFCPGETLHLQGTASGGSEPYIVNWTQSPNTGEISGENTFNPIVNPVEPTTYSVEVMSKGGCKANASINVSINPAIYINDVTQAPDIVQHCGNETVTLSATASGGTVTSPSQYHYKWFAPNKTLVGNQSTTTITTSTSGYYYIEVRDNNNCPKRDSIYVNVSPLKVSLGSDFTLCPTNPEKKLVAELIGLGASPYSYNWETVSGDFSPLNPTGDSLKVSPSENTTYRVTVTDANNCSSSATVRGYTMIPEISINRTGTSSPDTFALCKGTAITLRANSTSTDGTWNLYKGSNPTSIQSQNGGNTFNYPFVPDQLDNETIKYKVTFSHSCFPMIEPDSVYITVLPYPKWPQLEFNKETVELEFCPGQFIKLSPKLADGVSPDDYNYIWRDEKANHNIIGDEFEYTFERDGKYSLEISTPKNCSLKKSFSVNEVIPPTIAQIRFESELTFCSNAPIRFQGISDADLAEFKWTTNGKGVFSSDIDSIVYYTPSIEDDAVYFNLLIKNVCGEASDNMQIYFFRAPVTSAVASETYIYPGQEITLEGFSTKDSISFWMFNDGSSDLYFSNPIKHAYYPPGDHLADYIAYNKNGCSDTTSLRITVTDAQIKYIPKFFSPASSNKDNAALKVFGTNITDDDFEFSVYNRWGERLFYTQSFKEANQIGWDGKHPSTQMEVHPGVYTWSIKLKYYDGKKVEETGMVTLVK